MPSLKNDERKVKPHVHALLGIAGSGKSRLLKALCKTATRLTVVDTLGEHTDLAPFRDLDEFRAVVLTGREFRASVRPFVREQLDYVVGACAVRRGMTLAIDELDAWFTDASSRLSLELLAMVRYGRHLDNMLVVSARRPAAIAREVTSQAVLWIFGMQEPRDRAYVRDLCGFDPGTLVEGARSGNVRQVARVDAGCTEILHFALDTCSLHRV